VWRYEEMCNGNFNYYNYSKIVSRHLGTRQFAIRKTLQQNSTIGVFTKPHAALLLDNLKDIQDFVSKADDLL
jgi:hypothetical protein